MIASLNGTIAKVEEAGLIIAVGGVGIRVFVPKTVLENAGGQGRLIHLYTHLIVRETELTLYGFAAEDDLSLFEVLLGVNGVGPKVALSILSTLSPEVVKSAIMKEDAAVLQRVPGIGKKTAERIMFQLRDKLQIALKDASVPLVADIDADVIEVLTALGFSIVESQSALQNIPREVKEIDERVQLALRYLDRS